MTPVCDRIRLKNVMKFDNHHEEQSASMNQDFMVSYATSHSTYKATLTVPKVS